MMSDEEGLYSSSPGTQPPANDYPANPESTLSVPPIPPLPAPQIPSQLGMMSPYNYRSQNTYRPYAAYGPRSYFGSYSPMGYSPYGFNSYPPSYGNSVIENSDSRFIRLAEESSRPTFQAIESLVRTVNSVSFMMESTYSALHVSFGAVLNVIESFSSFGSFLKKLVGSLLAFRIIRQFLVVVYSLLKNLGLISPAMCASMMEISHRFDAGDVTNVNSTTMSQKSSSWPFLMFLGLMVVVPYLLSRMIPHREETEQDDGLERLIAVHEFQARTQNELSVARGECVKQLPNNMNSPSWVLVKNGKDQVGYVPKNHLARLVKKNLLSVTEQSNLVEKAS